MVYKCFSRFALLAELSQLIVLFYRVLDDRQVGQAGPAADGVGGGDCDAHDDNSMLDRDFV